jgi:hypothetical protein
MVMNLRTENAGLLEYTFLLFLIVTLVTPVTGFMPSFCMAFLLFFSPRLCFDFPPAVRPSSPAAGQLHVTFKSTLNIGHR